MIFVSQYCTHRHPAFWEEPEVFDPERFTEERSADRPRFAYFPFGGGPRQCIGNALPCAWFPVIRSSPECC
jgi:cytochrome P450